MRDLLYALIGRRYRWSTTVLYRSWWLAPWVPVTVTKIPMPWEIHLDA